MDDEFEATNFDEGVDIGILEDAADFVSDNFDLPIVFRME